MRSNIFSRQNEHRRGAYLVIACVIASVCGVTTGLYHPTVIGSSQSVDDQGSEFIRRPVNGELTKGTPTYETLLPAGKTIADYGGWTRVSPPDRQAVYAYADTINAVPIRVSEQPLPKEFADQTPEQIQLLAQGYAANQKLTVGNAIAYIGTSAKGPQSVIVVKEKLLILIKASSVIPDSEWQTYIQSLR